MQTFFVDPKGRLLVSKQALLNGGIYTENSYRNQKSKGRIKDVKHDDGQRWVFIDSLTHISREKVINRFTEIAEKYTELMNDVSASGGDTTRLAVEFTAESLQINEPFIRSSIELYMNTHYPVYTSAYLDLGLNSNSVKGYAKQCALVQWVYDFVKKIESSEADAKRCEVMLRSFRMNLLTSLSNIELEVKIPLSEVRFNRWFDDVLNEMNKGKKPEAIVTVKRQSNNNASKITPEQTNIVVYWHINGTNMSVPALYKKWLVYGKENNWWMDKDGNFNPPTEGRLYQILAPFKNPHSLEKTDAVTYYLSKVPSASRELPKKKNHVWVIDGTAHNENVDKGTVRQHIYAIKVADVATLKMLGVAPLIGVREPFTAVQEAVLMAIRESGYKPAILHCDQGPSYKELERWCEEIDIKLYPANAGNARSKTIENMFYQADNDIHRYLKGYSGQNRTALSTTSRSSDKRETAGKKNARSASIAMEWVKTTGMELWNQRIIEQLERKECGKSPNQLWAEKESFVPALTYTQLSVLCGTLHKRKLTINGLDIEHNTKPYTYFPPIDTPEQREYAQRIFTHIPLDAVTTNQLKIYILKDGDPAPVFTHDNKPLGIWGLKTNTAFIADTKEEKAVLSNYRALQYRVEEAAREINATVKQTIERHPDFERIEELGHEMLTGKREAPSKDEANNESFAEAAKRWVSRYDKSELLTEEIEAKAGEPIQNTIYKTLVDPDTGETYKVKVG